MKFDIPDEWIYFGLGVMANHIATKINAHSLPLFLKKREDVVDINGDIVGYVNSRGDIIGN